MFGGALGLIFTKRYDDDEPWLSIRPDRQRYDRIKEEMAERVLTGYEPPRPDREEPRVHPWLQYLVKVGMPTALGVAVVAWVLHDATGNMKTIAELQRQQLQSSLMMQQEHTTIRERLDRAERMQGVVIDIQRAICVNAAKTFNERNGCMSAGSSR